MNFRSWTQLEVLPTAEGLGLEIQEESGKSEDFFDRYDPVASGKYLTNSHGDEPALKA